MLTGFLFSGGKNNVLVGKFDFILCKKIGTRAVPNPLQILMKMEEVLVLGRT